MTKVIIETPDDIPLAHTHLEAVMQSTRVVNAMAKWFGVDVKAAVSAKEDGKVISFSFEGERSKAAAENVGFFLENSPDLKSAFLKPSQVERLSGNAAVQMDLDKLARLSSNSFDMAVYDAGHNGSIVSRQVSAAEGQSKA
jgi:hypothetical protein